MFRLALPADFGVAKRFSDQVISRSDVQRQVSRGGDLQVMPSKKARIIVISVVAPVCAGLFLSRSAILNGSSAKTSIVSTSEDLNGFLNQPIVVGQGVGSIQVKKTTFGEVVSLLGGKFERREIEGSFGGKCVDGVCDQNYLKFTNINLDYSKYGILLGFRSVEGENIPENDLRVREIYITCVQKRSGCAFTGKTPEGIHLGSTRREVVDAIGPSDTWTGRQGIVSKRSGVNISFGSAHPTKTGYTNLTDDDPVESFEIFSPADYNEFQHPSL